MTKYEIMYIIRPSVDEEGRKQIMDKLENALTKNNAEIINKDEWGMRELAYEIEDHTKGYYVVMNVNATQEARQEYERILRLQEDVIRDIMIKDVR